jgi:hypothetical protein
LSISGAIYNTWWMNKQLLNEKDIAREEGGDGTYHILVKVNTTMSCRNKITGEMVVKGETVSRGTLLIKNRDLIPLD